MKDTGEDAYFCEGCGYFYSIESDILLEIPYWEMPAFAALLAMDIRSRPFKLCHLRRRNRKISKTRGKGFGK